MPIFPLPAGAGRIAAPLLALVLAVLAFLVADRAAAEKAPPPPAAGRTITILALGDSLTQGYGLPQDEGLVAQLQAWLDERGAGVRLINGGVSGDTTRGGRARLEWMLAGRAVDALIVALGGNDVLRGLPPEQARANLAAILDLALRRHLPVLLVGVRVPPNYGPAYQARFQAIYPELAARYDALLMPDILAPLTAGRDPAEVLETLMQPDALHPNAAGVALIVAAMGPLVLELRDRVGRPAGRAGTGAGASPNASSNAPASAPADTPANTPPATSDSGD